MGCAGYVASVSSADFTGNYFTNGCEESIKHLRRTESRRPQGGAPREMCDEHPEIGRTSHGSPRGALTGVSAEGCEIRGDSSVTSSLIRVVASMAIVVAASGSIAAPPLPTLAPNAEDLPGFALVDPDTSAEIIAPPSGEDGFRPLAPIRMDQFHDLPMVDLGPAVTESSGTWLRRGLWYADMEGVLMTRTWDSNDVVLFQELDAVQNQIILSTGVDVAAQVIPIQSAEIGESSPGSEGMARLSLGRFLFRDMKNRDHTAEMIVFGGGEFNEQQALSAVFTEPGEGFWLVTNNGIRDEQGLQIPIGIDGSGPLNIDTLEGVPSFDRALEMETEYSSRFYTFEWNYNLNQRMQTDRMELLPTGEWVRRASPGVTWSYLAGLRYFDLEEQLDWSATGIRSQDDADGVYLIHASNNLFGVQLGLAMTYESDRWNVSVHSKHGFYANDARVTDDVSYTGSAAAEENNFTNDNHDNALSFVSQGGVTARYHLRPNLSLRVGWEYLFVSGVALAPNNANFIPTKEQIGVTSDIFYQGVSAGTEYFW
jgi:hypothetical protein